MALTHEAERRQHGTSDNRCDRCVHTPHFKNCTVCGCRWLTEEANGSTITLCSTCGGEGLLDGPIICPACKGSGKRIKQRGS